VEHLVSVFREVRRVLRDDGTVWLNLGDSYAGSWGDMSYPGDSIAGRRFGGRDGGNVGRPVNSRVSGNLKPKDLVGIPWRVAFALQADGWWLRSDVIWAKGVSFCDSYSGSVMPESVNGWRWERHRVKVVGGDKAHNPYQTGAGTKQGPGLASRSQREAYFENGEGAPKYTDCPGCPKCEANDGYILRRGSWRPTKAHEYLFLLAKSADYFCDVEAVKEAAEWQRWGDQSVSGWMKPKSKEELQEKASTGRNPRTVWTIPTAPYSGAHFATFPPALVEPCIKAGTSKRGVCPVCGAPWVRVVEKTGHINKREPAHCPNNCDTKVDSTGWASTTMATDEWRPTCDHEASPIPAIVLDPFCGSGTTLQEARCLGRRSVGLDLSSAYLADNARERLQLAALDAWENGSESVVAVMDGLPLFEIGS